MSNVIPKLSLHDLLQNDQPSINLLSEALENHGFFVLTDHALSIVKSSATTADDHTCKLRLDRPSASGCLWKRGAEDDGSRRNVPVLASLRRICTVAGLYNGFQRSDESNGERQGGGRSVGARLPASLYSGLGGGSTFGLRNGHLGPQNAQKFRCAG